MRRARRRSYAAGNDQGQGRLGGKGRLRRSNFVEPGSALAGAGQTLGREEAGTGLVYGAARGEPATFHINEPLARAGQSQGSLGEGEVVESDPQGGRQGGIRLRPAGIVAREAYDWALGFEILADDVEMAPAGHDMHLRLETVTVQVMGVAEGLVDPVPGLPAP